MVNVLRKPPRKPPQLLALPERERVERALRAASRGPLEVVALELERNESFEHGEVLEFVAVVLFPPDPAGPGKSRRLTLRHVMPGGAPNMREIIGGAEAIGQAIRIRFRSYGGVWASPVLFD